MENETPKTDSVETCLGVDKPKSPPAGHFNGHYDCTTTGWVWVDDIDGE